ncbi:MAG: response regulator [Oscillospiraceae bacterium]
MIKVIIADDEEKVAQLIYNLVDWQALEMKVVGIAHNGIEALALADQYAPDLMITDVRMPGCDGLSLIRQAKQKYPQVEFIIISGYRHFEYAQSAIQYGVSDYLLKPIKKDELTATLEKMKSKYQNRREQLSQQEQLRLRIADEEQNLRASLFLDLENAEYKALTPELLNTTYGYRSKPGVFQIMLLKIDGEYDLIHGDGLQVMRQKVKAALQERFAGFCYEFQAAFTGTTVRVLLNYDAEKSNEVRRRMRAVLDAIRVQNSIFPGAVFTCAIAQPQDSPAGLTGALQAARRTLASRILRGAGGLLEALPEEDVKTETSPLLPETTKALQTAMEVMDKQALAGVLQRFAQRVKADSSLTGEDILHLAAEVCSSYFMLSRSIGIRLADTDMIYNEFENRLDLCSTLDGVLECLTQTILITFSAALQTKSEEEGKPVRSVKQHISSHYNQPITLEQMAELAGFNASYFSTLFKKETGQTFSEYLQAVRIERAKELLRETDLPISRICEDVGYSDLKHFSATFRKVTGIKPGEFRKLYS